MEEKPTKPQKFIQQLTASSSHVHPQKRSNSQQLDGGKRALMCSSVLKINTSETVCVTAGLNTYKTLSLPMERAQIRLMI